MNNGTHNCTCGTKLKKYIFLITNSLFLVMLTETKAWRTWYV